MVPDSLQTIIQFATALLVLVLATKLHQTISHAVKRRISGHVIDWPEYADLTGIPLPKPLSDFRIEEAKPRPYRPFRWEYYQTMCKQLVTMQANAIITSLEALMAMEPDWWLELESTYRERLVQRRRLYEERGKAIIDSRPGSEEACQELMEMVIQFLCARYPNQFSLDVKTGIFHNQILNIKCDVRGISPLIFLLEHVPEDFGVVQADKETGLYHLRAAVTCSAVGWRLQEKIGRPLHEIHAPVPDYKERMRMSMDRYFSKLPCDKPIQRGAWTLEIGQPLYLQPGDEGWSIHETGRPDLKVEDIFLRVDWQTLRRLPKSQAIAFNFKALFTPVASFRSEPYIPRLLLKILHEGKRPLIEEKSKQHVNDKLIPALEEWALEQEEKGWVPKDWEERTLDESPFFPGKPEGGDAQR